MPSPFPDLHVFRDTLRDSTFGPEMVAIPAGTFLMGSPPDEAGSLDRERPQHQVSVPRFSMGRYPVTFEEYDRYCSARGVERPKDKGWGRGRRPVINVSWNDSRAYCAWLSAESGKVYRLPSEAEWEYACRAGTVKRYSWGDALDTKLANTNEEVDKVGKTTEVGDYPANPWMLIDMHGNVWEWCANEWHENYDDAPVDGVPRRRDDSGARMLRGGSWSHDPADARCANRVWNVPLLRIFNLGFRVVCSSPI